MVETICPTCGTKFRKREREDNGFNFCSKECEDNVIYEFDNQKYVCDKYNLDTGAICRVLQKTRKSTKGWVFYKFEDYISEFGSIPKGIIFDYSKEELYIDIK